MQKKNFSKLKLIPDNTILEVTHDFRSGNNLEIVIPVFNEEKRIVNLINYYKGFDLIIIDHGSTDNTLNIAVNNNVSVVKKIMEIPGEGNFIYYVNLLSKSGICLYLMADEFIKYEDLTFAMSKLIIPGNQVVVVNKNEFIYGESIGTSKIKSTKGMPRGLKKGYAYYDPYHFHNGIKYDIDNINSLILIELYHLHIKSIKDEYGKIGKYIEIEVSNILEKKYVFYSFIRRFLVPIITLILWRNFKPKISFSRKIFRFFELILHLNIAILVYFEKKYMISIEEQQNLYNEKYKL